MSFITRVTTRLIRGDTDLVDYPGEANKQIIVSMQQHWRACVDRWRQAQLPICRRAVAHPSQNRHMDIEEYVSIEYWMKISECHYNCVIMGSMAFQITSLAIVYSAVYLGADQRKHQSSASLAFVKGIHRRSVNSPHKGPLTRKMFPFDDDIMVCDFVIVSPDNNLAWAWIYSQTSNISSTKSLNLNVSRLIWQFLLPYSL